MKLLYGDNLLCSEQTMKRLMIIADEIGFLDRPSVMGKASGGGQWGLVGAKTPIRQFSTEDTVVKWTAFEPAPELTRQEIYQSYVEADFKNPLFISTILEGLKDDAFAEKLIQLQGNYGAGRTGEVVRQALLRDTALRSGDLTPDAAGGHIFDIEAPEGRLATLKLMGMEVSVRVTGTLLNSEHYGIAPVSDDRVFSRLLAMRTSSGAYVGTTARLAPFLGLHLVSAVIPDEVLQKLSIQDIDTYRKASADAYIAWAAEINQLSSKVDDAKSDDIQSVVSKIIAEELAPKLIEYKNEMENVRDKLFGDLVKAVTKIHYQIPTLSIAYLTHDVLATVGSFVAACAPAVAPAISDYISGKRTTKRRNSMSYLVGLTTRIAR